ncbi:MAG: hypothetical protein WC780_18360 [Lentimicrobiaceae bacterium]|jgi:hypothetical protein
MAPPANTDGVHLSFYANNKLYIVGGFVENETSITPSPDLYSIDLSEFNKSVIYFTKIL